MKRRQFVKASIGGGVTIGLVGGGAAWLSISANKEPLTIDAALNILKTLSYESISSLGDWNPAQIFIHCAQSIEYSMYGFPVHKSFFFKNTIGQFAFSMFSSKGRMTHGLNEPIPGAPILDLEINITTALDTLKKSLMTFKQYEGKFSPHFAYGELSKKEYEIAHVLHFYNHLQEIKIE
jgi:hypothetical protein